MSRYSHYAWKKKQVPATQTNIINRKALKMIAALTLQSLALDD